jgi:2,3-bisphosphoglycerate-dependent phosphoglycerate mutase
MTTERVIPFWRERIAPLLQQGLRVLVSAHGNSLRGLVKYLDAIPDEEIPGFEIPTGVPLIYDIRADGSPGGRFFLREEGEHRPGADTEETKR